MSGTLPGAFGNRRDQTPANNANAYQSLETLSLCRNLLSGNTDALEHAFNLTTLILSSNLLQCEAEDLDHASKLGVGVFYDPEPESLRETGAFLKSETTYEFKKSFDLLCASTSTNALRLYGIPVCVQEWREVVNAAVKKLPSWLHLFLDGQNPFELIDRDMYPSLVLAFAGNPGNKGAHLWSTLTARNATGLTTKASILPPVDAGKLLQEDQILRGRRSLFSGYSNLKLLLFVTLPLLLLAHCITVVATVRRADSSLTDYLTSSSHEGMFRRVPPMIYFYLRSWRVLLAMAVLGVGLLILNVKQRGVFGEFSDKDTCRDPIIRTTIAETGASQQFQWLFVTMSSGVMFALGFVVECLQRYDPRHRSVHVHAVLWTLAHGEMIAQTRSALATWEAKALGCTRRACVASGSVQLPGLYSPKIPLWRRGLYYTLFLLVATAVSAPAVAYVIFQNIPTGDEWWRVFVDNSLSVAAMKSGIGLFIIPRVAQRLATFKYAAHTEYSTCAVNSNLAIKIHTTQVSIVVLADVVAGQLP